MKDDSRAAKCKTVAELTVDLLTANQCSSLITNDSVYIVIYSNTFHYESKRSKLLYMNWNWPQQNHWGLLIRPYKKTWMVIQALGTKTCSPVISFAQFSSHFNTPILMFSSFIIVIIIINISFNIYLYIYFKSVTSFWGYFEFDLFYNSASSVSSLHTGEVALPQSLFLHNAFLFLSALLSPLCCILFICKCYIYSLIYWLIDTYKNHS